jgi:predicted DNA-binding transcriptional regulator AlpA
MAENPIPKHVRASVFADATGLHVKTIYKLADEGVLPSVKLTRKCLLFPLDECLAVLEKRTRRAAK